jgi:hypothetical protein
MAIKVSGVSQECKRGCAAALDAVDTLIRMREEQFPKMKFEPSKARVKDELYLLRMVRDGVRHNCNIACEIRY